MAKIMLVEDDKNLSAIYKDRLLAEGYDIVEAHDGEEALALAVKEKPILIISDVMMPKISGFDMLDILRSTPETKNTKVIMMTALSQSEDQQRATQLGADKYLVKSQVTLDDVARVVKEVLASIGDPAVQPSPLETPAAASAPESSTAPSMAPAQAPEPAPSAMPSTPQVTAETVKEEKNEIEKEIENFGSSLPTQAPQEVSQAPSPSPVAQTEITPAAPVAAPVESTPQVGEKVVNPINDASKPDIMALYEQEMAKETGSQPSSEAHSAQPAQPFDPHNISL